MKETMTERLEDLWEIAVTYSLACIFTSLYIYITIVASPALILLILKCTPYGRTDHYFEAFKAFPWIGINALILRSSAHPTVRNSFLEVCSALIFYFLVMYLIYYLAIIQLTGYFFTGSMEGGVPELLFGYLAIVEFASLLFMRTKPFIKYFPAINSLNILLSMLYCKMSPYGFKPLAILTV